ncbi:putative nonribosomal peptide synthetase [Bisporella sp. PMI_857]|nr:putative nonribosomal peptide synthetase [Bisporella sp. PMI_857]
MTVPTTAAMNDPRESDLSRRQRRDAGAGLDGNEIEDILRVILIDVLRISEDELDQTRSFLSLGGDSLLAIKVMGRCRAKGITLNVIDMIEAKSIIELAQKAHRHSEKPGVSVVTKQALDHLDENTVKNILGSTKHTIQSVLPCSTIQEGFMTSQSTNPRLYQCSYVLRFTSHATSSPIQAQQLATAWNGVVQRHSILRTLLLDSVARPGQYDQVVLDNYTPAIEFYNGVDDPSSVMLTARAFKPFAPFEVFHRVQIAQISVNEVHLKLDISHALVDGQSSEVILRDLCAAYRGISTAAPAMPYEEFVTHLSSAPIEPSQKHWIAYLEDAQSTFLPMDRGHAALSELDTLHTTLNLDASMVQDFCGTYGVTLANVCQLAWGLVLRSFTGADDVVFSFITSGRLASLEGIQEAVGPFVNTSLCRLKFDGTMHIDQILGRVARDSLEGFLHRYTTLTEDGAQTLPSARQLGNTTMSYQRVLDIKAAADAGIGFEIIDKANPTDYDIAIGIEASAHGLSIDLDFWKSRMNRGHAQDVLKVFREAIHRVLYNPRVPATEISLLGEDDLQQLHAWNREMPLAMPYGLHEKVLSMAQRQPDAVAVCAWDGDLTYAQLVATATTLAHHLAALGVGPECMVGLCMDKSKWAVISMLAILQAGGAVVPLGVTHPLRRLEGIILDAAISLIMVDEGQAIRLANLDLVPTPQLLTVDAALLDALPTKPTQPTTVGTACSPNSPAWVIFTSGSTGTPKGVVLEHRALATSVHAHGTAFGAGPHTRAAQFAAYTFDVSISDIFSTLHHGGCVCIFSEASRMDNLTEALQTLRVNYVNLTPTVLRLLDPLALPLITTAVVGGEPLDPELVSRWAPQATVINSYGPSECAIISTCYSVSDPAEAAIVGFPTGTRLWVAEVTDPNRLCPRGVPGELLVDGPLLARGYLNDPAKTAASFITNPAWAAKFGLPPNLRFYRTGDLVRQNENGSLTHLGRRDTQVKIRGQRVEIEEIEHWVTRMLEGTRIASVQVKRQTKQKEQIGLVAVVEFAEGSPFYIPPTPGNNGPLPPTAALRTAFDTVRTALFDVLPAYMVPRLYLPVVQMPLNPSGKLDRRAVQQIIESVAGPELQQYTTNTKSAVSTNTEKHLQELWSKILGIRLEQVGADDHFFQIGGDSVAAIRMVGAARASLPQARLTVADILQYPQLSELAKMLDNRTGSACLTLGQVGDPERVDIAPFSLWEEASEQQSGDIEQHLQSVADACTIDARQIEDVYPCTPLQEGLMAISARQPTAYVSCQVFSLPATVDLARFQAAWQTITQAAPILRTRILFRPNHTSLQVVIRDPVQWRHSSSLAKHLDSDLGATMAPGQPLNDFGLVEEASGNRFFVWRSHHSTYDGWSVNLIWQQVTNIYLDQAVPRAVPYTRFIQYMLRADPDITQKYWEQQLSGNPAADFPPLPQANYHPRPRQQVSQKIDLRGLGNSTSELTMSDILRASWALVLAQHLSNEDVVFAVALSGRNAPVSDIESLMAPTLTTVPLRVHVDGTKTVQSFLSAIRKQGIEMIPYEHTGLQRIKQLVPEAEAALTLRHLFIVQPAAENEPAVGIPGMRAVPVDMEEFDSYGLNVECTLGPDAVIINARFDEKIISPRQLNRVLEQFAHVTQQLCRPAVLEKQVNEIEIISPTDIQQIAKWNQALPVTVERCIHEQVEEMAKMQPDAIAVDAWDGKLTYSELMTHAAALAHHLLHLGAAKRAETMVGLCMDKSKWVPVAMLAILQAGAVVVPLGVSHPLTRIDGILKDTAAEIVLVDAGQAERLAGLDNELLQLVIVDSPVVIASRDEFLANSKLGLTPKHPSQVVTVLTDSSLLGSLNISIETPHTGVKPHNAAWVIFTSGSTGVPKGVVLEHSALATSIQAHGDRFGVRRNSRVMQFAAHTFDAVIQDCFTTLIWGGTICIASEDDRMNNLAGAMRSMGVTFVNLTSTVARLLRPSDIPSLKTITLGGEAVQVDVVELWANHVNLLNTYGPSECSINSMCNGPLSDPTQASNIGYAMGTRLWVAQPTNPHQLAPIGVAGELLIEGPLLARGYLNDKEKTAASFITDPAFMNNPALGLSAGGRVYRTGDMVRQNEDGSLIYLGRGDMQVKIRGQRVEIGEIEYWISKLQLDVRLVTVVFTDNGKRDQQRLVAIIEFAENSKHRTSTTTASAIDQPLLPSTSDLQADFSQLRTSLLEILPAYMVPSIFVPVSKVPLNLSGKLDRRAAREIVDAIETTKLLSYATTRAKAPPSTETERQLVLLWGQVLGIDGEVGAQDHFFHIGGDSVAAMRIVTAARASQLYLTVGDIFQHPRLSELAELLDNRQLSDNFLAQEVVEPAPFEMWREAIGV